MDGKAIDTKIVRFPCSPSFEAGSLKEAHDVALKLESVHAEQKLAKRHLVCRDGETGGVHWLLLHRSLHLRGSTTQPLILDDNINNLGDMRSRFGACNDRL